MKVNDKKKHFGDFFLMQVCGVDIFKV